MPNFSAHLLTGGLGSLDRCSLQAMDQKDLVGLEAN